MGYVAIGPSVKCLITDGKTLVAYAPFEKYFIRGGGAKTIGEVADPSGLPSMLGIEALFVDRPVGSASPGKVMVSGRELNVCSKIWISDRFEGKEELAIDTKTRLPAFYRFYSRRATGDYDLDVEVKYRNWKLNAVLSDRLFRPEPPAGYHRATDP
jgi:outer membrane lipoprotein-sorting protein